MEIQQLHHLNEKQKSEIDHLVQSCFLKDELERTLYLNNDLNFYENLDSFYLLYDKERLVSVLTICQESVSEAEISAYTLPEERNKGYFTVLLDCAEEELVGFDIFHIVFVIEPKSESGIRALKACKAKYSKSEYILSIDISEWHPDEKILKNIEDKDIIHSNFNMKKGSDIISLVELQPQNLKRAANLSSEIFSKEMQPTLAMLNSMMKSEQLKCYCAYLSNEMIGICNVNYETNYASIFDLGIEPLYQGKGYGKILINQVLAKIGEHKIKYITLQVGSENQRAFLLYKSVGFQIQTQYDYYDYMIECEEIE